MKFIHAADLHIDSPLRGLDSYEGAPVSRLRGASRHALSARIFAFMAVARSRIAKGITKVIELHPKT